MAVRLGWLLGLLLCVARPALAETVVLDAVRRGQPVCALLFGCTELTPDGSYAIGGPGNPSLFLPPARNAFQFDLSPVTDPIVAASLVLVNPPGGFVSRRRSLTYLVHGVSLPAEAVTSELTYSDVGSGARLGEIEVDPSSPTTLEIPLAAPFLRVLERTDGIVALGGSLTTREFKKAPDLLFVGTGPTSGVPAPRLVLTTDPNAVPAPAAVLHVDAASGEDSGDGSPEAPFRSIEAALDLAVAGDVVDVAPGVYAARVILREDVELRGRDPGEAIIDVTELSLPRSVICAEGALLEGFRLRDTREGFDSDLIECGASTEISHNVFENVAGASIRQSRGMAWVHHNQIQGTISIESANGVVEANEIEPSGNAAAAVSVLGPGEGTIVVRRNRIRGTLRAGGEGVELTIASNLFLPPPRSLEHGAGGAFLGKLAAAHVLHNTFYATDGVRVFEGVTRVASNVLVHGTAGILVADGARAVFHHNDVFRNRDGIGGGSTNYVGLFDLTGFNSNLSVDPDFVDAFEEDFRLRADSPALDAGSSTLIEAGADFDGDPRVMDGDGDGAAVVDMGAQELQPGEVLPERALPIEVDLLPGKSPNQLKLSRVSKGKGKVAVALLSSEEFDAPAEVDVDSLRLDYEGVRGCRVKDVDRDGFRDLACSFPLRGISLEPWPIQTPAACVRGRTLGGRKLLGCDSVEFGP